VWTRFHPIAYKIQEAVFSGRLGQPKRFSADFSIDFNVDAKPLSDRFLDPALGGGSLLDMGPYPSVWAMLLLYQHPDNHAAAPKLVNSYQRIYGRTGVDARSRWLLDFEELGCEAQLMTDMTTHGLRDATAVLQCQEGDLVIEFGPQKPSTFHVIPHRGERETHHHPIPAEQGHGLCFEADEVARCIRDGRTESERMPLAESRVAQSWLDEVRRRGPTCMKDMKGTA
jgi:predicted dehydrogenase